MLDQELLSLIMPPPKLLQVSSRGHAMVVCVQLKTLYPWNQEHIKAKGSNRIHLLYVCIVPSVGNLLKCECVLLDCYFNSFL